MHGVPRGTDAPRAGDVAICEACGGVGVFIRQQQLRRPTSKEQRVFLGDPLVQRAVWGVLSSKGQQLH